MNAELILNAIERSPEVKPVVQESTKKKDNPVKCILFIDEAHELFAGRSSEQVIHDFTNKLQKISHHGIAIYIVTQQISHLKSNGESLIPVLENRIFHQINDGETEEAKKLLLGNDLKEDSVYTKIEDEISKLPKGRTFIRFIDQDGKSLSPLKVQIFKEKFK